MTTHGNGLYVLLWLLMGMASATVETHGYRLYYCGYSWEWFLLLWLRIEIASTILDTLLLSIYWYALNLEDYHKRNYRGFLEEDELEKYIRDCGYSY